MKKTAKTLLKSIKKFEIIWRYGYNFSPAISYAFQGNNKLNQIENDIVKCLNQDGIAFSSAEELLTENSSFMKLDSVVNNLLETRKEEIAQLKSRANNKTAIGNKTFNLELLGSELTFNAENVFAKFALNQTLLNIANAYFQMYAKVRYYNVWKTFASTSEARESQLWHFDREDKYILKLFLYLDDVDEGAGPFTYAPETHQKGRLKNIQPEFFLEGGVRRTTDEQMNAVFPKENWKVGIGKKGTLILADTRGFHKGGEARTNDRLMYTCMYTSSASESKRLINYPNNIDSSNLTELQLKALMF
jgi:hypothetical protein